MTRFRQSPSTIPRALRRTPLAEAFVLLLLAACGPGDDLDWLEYPEAPRGDVVDVYHGVEVADPYRWLEDEESDATLEWLAAQDAITERFYADHTRRLEMLQHLEATWTEGVASVPVRRGDRTFRWKSVEGRPHDVLTVRIGDGQPEVIFDLAARHPGENVSTRTTLHPSPEGRYVGYVIHRDGADVKDVFFYDTEAGRELEEFLPAVYGGEITWLPDESGFFYSWLDLPTLRGEDSPKEPGLYFHAIGTPLADDPLVYRRPWEGRRKAFAEILGGDDDGNHRLLIHDMDVMSGRGRWGVRPLTGGPETPVRWLLPVGHRFARVGSRGSEIFLVTDLEAPNWRVVALDADGPGGLDALREVVPEGDAPIAMNGGWNTGLVLLHGERLLVTYLHHTSHVIRLFGVDGAPRGEIEPPFYGSVTSISSAEDDPVVLLGLTSFLRPEAIYAYDLARGTLDPAGDEPATDFEERYDTRRVFYESYDGTRVPLTILRPRDTPTDGSSQTMLYGYGGWGLPTLPSFRNRVPAWLARGHTYAVAHLRGGGEYGVAWHEAGMKEKKQDVFDDFYAAAEYLVDEGYTRPERLTILGASNGGLLTAVAYNQRPELFGAVISEVAVTDMLRIQETPIGATATEELGHPAESPEMFRTLLSYSPLHNVRHEGPYPPILHVVGENDPRCTPGHIYKYVAEMQHGHGPERPVILRLVRGAGHGSRDKEGLKHWLADELAFAEAMTAP